MKQMHHRHRIQAPETATTTLSPETKLMSANGVQNPLVQATHEPSSPEIDPCGLAAEQRSEDHHLDELNAKRVRARSAAIVNPCQAALRLKIKRNHLSRQLMPCHPNQIQMQTMQTKWTMISDLRALGAMA